jgi:hypothetical protein
MTAATAGWLAANGPCAGAGEAGVRRDTRPGGERWRMSPRDPPSAAPTSRRRRASLIATLAATDKATGSAVGQAIDPELAQTTARPPVGAAASRGASSRGPRSLPADGVTILDRYRLIRRLGSGAFGTVWMAHDERLGRDVAVKVLASERIVGGRFEREARAAARLAHPGIVTLYEAAVDEEGAYLVSQLVLGETLDTLLAEGALSDRDIVAVGVAMCDALEHAHAHGIVHRDVKPSNVLIPQAPANAAEVAKLTDFGVARIVDADQLTLTGDVVGTLAYMAPEQADGLSVGPEADLYALALVLYEALTGINPVAVSAQLRPIRRLGAHLPPLRRQRRDLPRVLGQGIDQALRPRPRERGRLRDLRDALAGARDEVSDDPGIVGAAWSPLSRDEREHDAAAGGWGATPYRAEAGRADEGLDDDGRALPAPGWPERALGGAGGAGIAAWTVSMVHLKPAAPATAALIAGAALLIAPRLGWLALVIAASAAAALDHQPGLALLMAASLLLAPLLLLRRGGLWGVAAAAPALGMTGVTGLAGCWPAVAGRARTPWRRAVLGALGWVWLVAVSSASGQALLSPRVRGIPSPARVDGSISAVMHGLIPSLLHSGALIPALVWAGASVIMPWVVRGGSGAAVTVRALAWALGVGVAPAIVVEAAAGSGHAPGPAAVPIGVLGALIVILGPWWIAHRPTRMRGGDSPRILP